MGFPQTEQVHPCPCEESDGEEGGGNWTTVFPQIQATTGIFFLELKPQWP